MINLLAPTYSASRAATASVVCRGATPPMTTILPGQAGERPGHRSPGSPGGQLVRRAAMSSAEWSFVAPMPMRSQNISEAPRARAFSMYSRAILPPPTTT